MIVSEIEVAADSPTIGIVARLINGVPVLFTERGELIRGQQRVAIVGEMRSVVTAEARIIVENPE